MTLADDVRAALDEARAGGDVAELERAFAAVRSSPAEDLEGEAVNLVAALEEAERWVVAERVRLRAALATGVQARRSVRGFTTVQACVRGQRVCIDA